jgi:hypothetical protein
VDKSKPINSWEWRHGDFEAVDLYVAPGVLDRVPSLAWFVGPVVQAAEDVAALELGLQPIEAQHDLRLTVIWEPDHDANQWGRVAVAAFLRG